MNITIGATIGILVMMLAKLRTRQFKPFCFGAFIPVGETGQELTTHTNKANNQTKKNGLLMKSILLYWISRNFNFLSL
eukprot:m.49166 g.49166  ORF g.49166 m.49166 type:complete len:78 (-) comp17888_c0_seq1:2456-2689(-)